MKKNSLLCAVLLSFVLPAMALAAPTAAELTANVVPESDVISVGVRDMRALEAEVESGSLLGRIVKMFTPHGDMSRMALCDNTSLRVGLKPESDGAKTTVFAARLVDGASPESFLRRPPEGVDTTPDFTVSAPLTALATVKFDVEGVRVLRFARLDLDGAVYFLATNSDASLLEKMASAEEISSGDPHEGENLWCGIDLSEAMLAHLAIDSPQPMQTEISFSGTEKTLSMHIWNNFLSAKAEGALSAMAGVSLEEVLGGTATADAPVMIGSGPLMGLFNLCCAALPENLQLSDAMSGEDLAEATAFFANLEADTGLGWEDIVKVLRHNITVGIAGKSSVLGAEFPGIWVHLEGLTGAKGEEVVAQLRNEIGFLASDYSVGDWKGFRVSMPASVLVASGPDGVIAALMDSDQFDKTPEVPAELAQVTEQRGFALGLNLKDLCPELLKIYERYGDMLLPLVVDDKDDEESIKAADEAFRAVLNNLGMFEAAELYAVGSECFTIELTPKPDMVNMMLPPILPAPPAGAAPAETQTEAPAAAVPAA